MLDIDNSNRNIKSDFGSMKFWKKKPTLLKTYSSKEVKTLWQILSPRRFIIFILTFCSFLTAFMEGIKALLLVGFIKAFLSSEQELTELFRFSFLGRNLEFINLFPFQQGRLSVFIILFVSFLFIILLTSFLKLGMTWLTTDVQLKLMRDVRDKILNKIFTFDLDYFNNAKSGELIFLMNSETSRFSKLVTFATNFFNFGLQVIVFIGMLLYMMYDFTVLVILFSIIYFIIHIRLDVRIKIKSWAANLSQNSLSHIFHQIIYGIKMIKIGGLENRENNDFLKEHNWFENESIRLGIFNGLSKMFQDISFAVLMVLICLYSYYVKDYNELVKNPSNLLAYLFLLMRLVPVATGLQNSRTGLIGAYGPLARVMAVLHLDDGVDGLKRDVKQRSITFPKRISIKINNLGYGYSKKELILKNINLNFKNDSLNALVGYSGSGKSTLLDLISMVRMPAEGEVVIGDKKVDLNNRSQFKQMIGYMNQEPIIFHESVRENVRYFKPQATDEEIWEALKLAEAFDIVRDMPAGLDTGMGERGLTVSGGQRQRIGLARVLLQDSPILLLDEATNALDYETEKKIYNNLKRYKNEKLIIAAAHRLSAIKDFDQIVVLNNGSVIEKGVHSELMSDASFYRSLFLIQNQESK
jgi:ATP-binding cassette, subfamily B, bacterial MsbA